MTDSPIPTSLPADGVPLIDVIIPTLNEAGHISEAVANAKAVGPVYVLDSLSTDGTQELAVAAGATLVEHRTNGYARQKNWGLENLPLRGQWVFILDADERFTPALAAELRSIASSRDAAVGYFVNRLTILMGRPVRFGGMYPAWNLRFFRRGMARYEDRAVHEHMLCDGPTAYLRHHLLHIRRESISQYITKHIRYADLESDEWLKWRRGSSKEARAGELFKDAWRYRQLIRRVIWPRVPCRPLIRFLYMYFFKLGILDGKAGWHLAWLMSNYEYMISLLYREKLEAARGRTEAPDAVSEPAPSPGLVAHAPEPRT